MSVTPSAIHRCVDIYVDAYVLQDPSCENLFQYAAQQRVKLYLFLHDVMEKETISKLDCFGYICDIVYGESIVECVLKDIKKRNASFKKTIVLTNTEEIVSDVCVVSIGEKQSYPTLESFLQVYFKKQRALRNTVVAIIVSCILYFAFYLGSMDELPKWMTTQTMGIVLFLIIPSIILFGSIGYGIQRRLFSVWEVLDYI